MKPIKNYKNFSKLNDLFQRSILQLTIWLTQSFINETSQNKLKTSVTNLAAQTKFVGDMSFTN